MSNQVSSQSRAFAEELKTLFAKYGFNYLSASAFYPSNDIDHKSAVEVRITNTDDGRVIGKIQEESTAKNEVAL